MYLSSNYSKIGNKNEVKNPNEVWNRMDTAVSKSLNRTF